MEIKKIQCVTFPRSGHNLLAGCLRSYFKEDFHYCEFYSHCMRSPCIDPQTNFQKNHDFGLKLPIDMSHNYIIQYRHPIASLISLYETSLMYCWITFVSEDSRSEWIRYCHEQIDFWKRFVRKWIINNHIPNIYNLEYSEFINNPVHYLQEIINFINSAKPINMESICNIVTAFEIKPRRDIKKFKYYDPYFLKEIEEKVHEELSILNIRSYF